MNKLTFLAITSLGAVLVAQTTTPAPTAPAAPAGPIVKFRGAFWGSGAISDKQTADGSLFLQPVASGNGQLAVDGVQIGVDVTLTDGWAIKATILGGQTAKVLNAADVESGSTTFSEAQLIYTGSTETFKFGRMWTPMGMEVMDQTQDIMATRGILFTFSIPFSQVGADWHHTFSTSWSSDVYVFNGEDRVKDNNNSKSVGLGLTYNHAGATDKFLTFMVFRGPEQDGLGAAAHKGAEGRQRERACATGQWTWGTSTLQGEIEFGREAFLSSVINGSTKTDPETETATWKGFGLIYKAQLSDTWALLARGEYLKDDTGVRLSYDPSVATLLAANTLGTLNGNFSATSFAVGAERKWGNTFARLEARHDKVNKEMPGQDPGKTFSSANSATFSFGASF